MLHPGQAKYVDVNNVPGLPEKKKSVAQRHVG